MHVFHVEVTFGRTRQPKDYESARCEVSYHAALDEGEDHAAATERLVDDASGVVYRRLGMKVPAVSKAGTPEEEDAEAEKSSQKAPPAEKKAAAPKKGGKKAAAPKKDGGSEEGAPAPEPEKDANLAAGQVSDADLQKACMAAAKKVGSDRVKEAVREFGVARVAEVPAEDRPKLVAQLEEMAQ